MKVVLLVFALSLALGCSESMKAPPPEAVIVVHNDANNEELPPECDALVCGDQCGQITNACGDVMECGACVDEARLAQMQAWLEDFVEEMLNQSYIRAIQDFDFERVRGEVHQILRQYRASDAGLVAALRHALLESRIGHAAIYHPSTWTCTGIEGAGDSGASQYGACAVPHSEGMLVTHTGSVNPLGLQPGDMVVAANGIDGEELFEWSLAQPVCGSGAASDEARREEAARSFFSAPPVGTSLTVRTPQGEVREVDVPRLTAPDWLFCGDPLGRSIRFVVRTDLREDGVAVIRLPGFTPAGGLDPQRDPYVQMEELRAEIRTAFESVRQDARAIVWDVRSNFGGFSLVAFAIVGGFPGASQVPIARCSTRTPHTDPEEFQYFGPNYDLMPNGEFEFDGPVAILIDGRTFSAGDYFARATSIGTGALIVGTPTAGAYGGSGSTFDIGGEYGLVAAYDPFRCDDIDGVPLETRGVQPDIQVEYDPIDISNGVDTVLERAAAELLER